MDFMAICFFLINRVAKIIQFVFFAAELQEPVNPSSVVAFFRLSSFSGTPNHRCRPIIELAFIFEPSKKTKTWAI